MLELTPITVGYLGIGGLLVFLLLGMPIAFASLVVGFAGLVAMRGFDAAMSVLGGTPYATLSSYSMGVVPMFVIMGYFAYHAGITRQMYDAARNWVGHYPGGLAVATIAGCTGFAAVSGSSAATAAVMARIALPEMRRYGYPAHVSAGAVAAGGTLSSMIPPSVILVVYAITVEQSVRSLLLAGMIPGLVCAAIFMLYIIVRSHFNPALGPPAPKVAWAERLRSLRGLWGILTLIAVVLGGTYTGVFTATEAGAAGAFGALVLALAARGLDWPKFRSALMETGRTTFMLFALIVGIAVFVRFLSFTGLPQMLVRLATESTATPLVILLLILFVFMILGMFMEPMGMMMLTLPFVFPVIVALGYDPIWFGIIFVKMAEMCMLTPPIGMNCFVVAAVDKETPLAEVFRGIMPYWTMDIVTVGLLIAFPSIALFLPRLMPN